ncbi:MAG: phage holin family protein [Leptospirales bacterium]
MSLILRMFLNALIVYAVAHVIKGVHIKGFGTAILVAIVLGLLNALIRPILFLLTLPINILTLGFFTFVLNALLFWSVTWFVPGFTVDSFISALVSSFLVSLMSLIFSWFLIF